MQTSAGVAELGTGDDFTRAMLALPRRSPARDRRVPSSRFMCLPASEASILPTGVSR